jgi:hypothetical protein
MWLLISEFVRLVKIYVNRFNTKIKNDAGNYVT